MAILGILNIVDSSHPRSKMCAARGSVEPVGIGRKRTYAILDGKLPKITSQKLPFVDCEVSEDLQLIGNSASLRFPESTTFLRRFISRYRGLVHMAGLLNIPIHGR